MPTQHPAPSTPACCSGCRAALSGSMSHTSCTHTPVQRGAPARCLLWPGVTARVPAPSPGLLEVPGATLSGGRWTRQKLFAAPWDAQLRVQSHAQPQGIPGYPCPGALQPRHSILLSLALAERSLSFTPHSR